MNITSKLACLAATFAAAGLMSGPAQAGQPADLHCPDQTGKIELSGEVTQLTGLEPGSSVCIKSGPGYVIVPVGESGTVTNPITNSNGKPRGISYYVPGECEPSYDNNYCEEEPPPPYET